MAEKDITSEKKGGGIQSLERAAAILDAVGENPDGIGLRDISSRVGLHTSTAYHLIKTLVALRFLTQDREGKKYRIGSRLFALASGASRENTLLNFARPVLEQLSGETGETSHLAIRVRDNVLIVARMEGAGMLQLSERAGVSRPMHATAVGKALLAFMPDQEMENMLAALPLPRVTEKTITSRPKLRSEIRKIRSEGVAYDHCEFDPDLRCFAMPIFDFTGACVATIGLSGPVWRMSAEMIERRLPRLAAAADDLSASLGYRPASQAAAIGA